MRDRETTNNLHWNPKYDLKSQYLARKCFLLSLNSQHYVFRLQNYTQSEPDILSQQSLAHKLLKKRQPILS